MTSVYPSSILTITNPTSANTLNSPLHSAQHSTINDNVIAIETKLGVNSSADTTTIDYKVTNPASNGGGHVQTANKGGTGQTSYNKGDILVGQSSSVLAKQAAGTDGLAVVYDSTKTNGLGTATILTAPVVQNQTYTYARASVMSASVYGINLASAPSMLSDGQSFAVKFPTQNTTSILALTVGATGPSSVTALLKNPDLTNIDVGAIKASMIGVVEFDSVSSVFQLVSYPNNVGTGAMQHVKLDATAKLPAVDGSQLTNLTFVGSFQKVSTQTISTTTTSGVFTKIAEWTGLTGDTDDVYQIEFEINSDQGSTSDFLGLRLNDDSTSNHYGYTNIRCQIAASPANVNSGGNTYYEIISAAASTTLKTIYGSVKVKASKTIAGTRRAITSEATGNNNSLATDVNERGAGQWTDTSNQIISMQLYFSQTSGSTANLTGSATVYKINR